MQQVVRKFHSFEGANAADRKDRLKLTPNQRVAIALALKPDKPDYWSEPPFRSSIRARGRAAGT
jgi:hypothetical protein